MPDSNGLMIVSEAVAVQVAVSGKPLVMAPDARIHLAQVDAIAARLIQGM